MKGFNANIEKETLKIQIPQGFIYQQTQPGGSNEFKAQ